MKTIKVSVSCLIQGQHAAAGQVIKDLHPAIANDLIATGRAIEVKAKAPEIETRDPVIETRDPEPPRKKK